MYDAKNFDSRVGRYGCTYFNGYWEAFFDSQDYIYIKTPPGFESYLNAKGRQVPGAPAGMNRGTWSFLDIADPHAEDDF